MPCYHPISAWHSNDLTERGKRPLLFKYNRKTCYSDEIKISCGQCIGCKLERSRQWAIRCVHESQLHTENTYITLTYNDAHLPDYSSLNKKHLTNFLKRLRKSLEPKKIRYFACGEYGEKLSRPHYHAIIFGHEFSDKIHSKTINDYKYYTSKTLDKIWSHGNCIIGDVTFESAAYVARYILKKINGENHDRHYLNPDVTNGELKTIVSEYIVMSRRPGIAAGWYDKYKRDLDKNYITMRGIKMSPPKYYSRLQEIDEPFIYDEKKLDSEESNRIADQSDNTTERLAIKEKIKLKKSNQLIRGFENDN